ncbi:MAG TPA: cobalamin biosynthesis protein CobD, partial [Cytophagales bacterium]|nr:cobalamin biosynthesis protein CobD [Cytophagales bacterium]
MLGDPRWLPHLIVLFGKGISVGERMLNQGTQKRLKGLLMVLALVSVTYGAIYAILLGLRALHPWLAAGVAGVLLFYC